jgi:hypothetical protein
MINDFIEYWSTACLLLSGGNPYSPAELLESQKALGWTQAKPLVMWNPPWTLSFTLPLGLLDYQTAQFVWFLSHTLIIFVGAQALWKIYGGVEQKSRYAWFSMLCFAPIYFVLLLGQIGPLILIGLIAFLAFVKRRLWSLGGASLIMAAIKPHLLYLLWLALFLWILRNRQWKFAISFMIAGAITVAIPLLFDGQVYSQYLALLTSDAVIRPLEWATPSLGTAIAEFSAISGAWIRWLPSFGGAMWFLWYWSRRAETWDWLTELPLVLLVSVATTSFGWTFDHVVLVPAVIQVAVWTSRSPVWQQSAIIIGTHVALGVILLVSKVFVLNDFAYFWVAPTYLLLYLYARTAIGAVTEIPDEQTVGA